MWRVQLLRRALSTQQLWRHGRTRRRPALRAFSTAKDARGGEGVLDINDICEVGDVFSKEELRACATAWWRFLQDSPRFRTKLAEQDIPLFLLQHPEVPENFHLFLSQDVGGDKLSDLQPLLLQAASRSPSLLEGDTEDLQQLMQVALSFIESTYAPQLKAFRRARRLADLRNPEKWFPVARNRSRRWHLHLGPTNSGKTHAAMQALLTSGTGLYLAPLRLLASEAFDRMRAAGLRCALRTGQEKAGPDDATHVACTVEMTPLSGYGTQGAWDVAVLDEIQLLTDPGRGWAWTRALLGTCVKDLHLCGAPEPASLPALLRELALSCGDSLRSTSVTPKRLVPLTVEKHPVTDLSKLLPGDCLVCFARAEVLEAKASLENLGLRCCCIYGSLPPEVRSEQAALFNDPSSGYDLLVASDAIGMGLNLQIRRVVFRSLQKFDGASARRLTDGEIRQIAGRAGRFGGRYSRLGLVACCAAEDVAAVEAALGDLQDDEVLSGGGEATSPRDAAADTERSARAALLPLPEQLEAFSQTLEMEMGRPLPFEDLVERFLTIAEVSPLYFLSQARSVIDLARFLSDVRLSPRDKFVFCQAPVGSGDAAALVALRDFVQSFVKGSVPFASFEVEDMQEVTPQKILELEGLHKVCEAYLWLSMRFPASFPEVEAAAAARSKVADKISKSLRRPLRAAMEGHLLGL